tara:strand:- start:5484 stop:5897 length:414 start_codon:yes stop_codon:yes gene_type:complete
MIKNSLNFIFFFSIILFFINLSTQSYSVEPNEILENKLYEERARKISKNIRCMVCQNQSIDDSDSALAKDLRILIREKIKENQSDKEIYKFLTDRYGDFILLKPAFKLNTLLLWFLPFVFLMTGLSFIYIKNKKFKK